MISVLILLAFGCSLEQEKEEYSINGNWLSGDNVYDGCYAHYKFSLGEGDYSGSYYIKKTKDIHSEALEEEYGTFVTNRDNTMIYLTSQGGTYYELILEINSKGDKIFLGGDPLHQLWNASRIALYKQ